MNRKLLNGMLVLAVAAGGVGTFTSCKDENFTNNEVLLEQELLKKQIDALRGVTDTEFRNNLEKWLNNWTSDLSGVNGFKDYSELVASANTMYDLYRTIVNMPEGATLPASLQGFAGVLYQWMFDNKIQGSDWYKLIYTLDGNVKEIQSQIVAMGGEISGIKGQIATIQGQMETLQSQIKAVKTDLENLSGEVTALKAELEAKYNELTAQYNALSAKYDELVKKDAEQDAEIDNIYDLLGDLQAQIDALGWVDQHYGFRASSVEINTVYNPVFGSINLPIGISSTILGTYKYLSQEGALNFPAGIAENIGVLSEFSISKDLSVIQIINELSSGNSYSAPAGVDFTGAEDFGNMGGAVLNINPMGNNYKDMSQYKIELVKSNGDVVMSTEDGTLELDDFNDVIYFGGTRASGKTATGLYKLNANATANNYKDMEFDLEKTELKDALKQAIDDKSISSMAHLGEMVLKSVNNKLPAYAVKVSWNDNAYDTNAGFNENAVLSKFDIASVVLHPLSYNLNIGQFIPDGAADKIPHINPLAEYLDKLKNKINITIDIDEPTIDPVDFDIKLMVDFESGENGIAYVVAYDTEGNLLAKVPYSTTGISTNPNDLQGLVNAILEAVAAQINQGLDETVNAQVVEQLTSAFEDINNSIKEQLEAQVGRLTDLINRIEESNKLTYAQKLVDVYNKLADKARDFLKDPEHYLQVMMAYSAGDGAHHLSTDPIMGTPVNISNGEAIELITSSYTGDILVPSFKKYVAITGIVGKNGMISTNGLDVLNRTAGLNQVYEGSHQRVAMKVDHLIKNTTYRLTYVSLDYRGMCSMNNYYIYIY